MRHLNRRSTQSGVVLVIGLMLLLIITIVAVASMSSTQMQERMAGNARTQALAFEVASGAASDSLSFYEDNVAELLEAPCTSPEYWETGAISKVAQPNREVGRHQVQLTQYLYCLQSEIETTEGTVTSFPQFFVLSRADVLAAGGGTTIARRAIETRIQTPGQPECGAICFLGCDKDDEYDMAMSNAYKVDGGDNPAITVPAECRERLRNEIGDKRLANYTPGGVSGFVGAQPAPWTSPETVDDFRKTLLARMGATDPPEFNTDPIPADFYIDLESPSDTGTIEPENELNNNDPADLLTEPDPNYKEYGTRFINPGSETFTQNGSETFGDATKPQITYIAGDADMAGNVSGTGILVVEGNLKWNGTPNFDGLILVLGGGFEVYGGGQGGNFAGSLMVVNIWNNHDPRLTDQGYYIDRYNKHDYDQGADELPAYLAGDFGPVAVAFTGGGKANYTYNCNSLENYSTDLALDPWQPACNSDDGGAVVNQIVSWRENIGWRVDFAD